MIAISLNGALLLYSGILLAIAIVIWAWTGLTEQRTHRTLEEQYRWRCAICGYVYLDESGRTLSQCPRCGSYNDVADFKEGEIVIGAPEHIEVTPPSVTGEAQGSSKRKRPGQRRRGGRRRR